MEELLAEAICFEFAVELPHSHVAKLMEDLIGG
jgi:hypothetical protein